MGERERITVLIPTFNEERNIRDAMESADWADEILVVDSFSTDSTLDIVREKGARVIQREYGCYAHQCNWAIPQATHEWVMLLDADERITPELRDEVLRFLESPGEYQGLSMYRANYFLGQLVRYCGWQSDKIVRVFRKDRIHFPDKGAHSGAVVDGPVKMLRGKMIHYTFDSFDQYMVKFNAYTRRASYDRGKRTKKVTLVHLAGRPAWRFAKQYILRGGFLEGRRGFVICALSAFSVFMKYARLWERQEHELSHNPPPTSSASAAAEGKS